MKGVEPAKQSWPPTARAEGKEDPADNRASPTEMKISVKEEAGKRCVNPLTVTVCKIAGMKRARIRTRLQKTV